MTNMDVFLQIEHVFKKESFRKMLQKVLGFPEMKDNVGAWCSVFWREPFSQEELEKFKKIMPDIELYIDVLAKHTKEYLDEVLTHLLNFTLTYALVHEIVHEFALEQDERGQNGQPQS